MRISRKRLTISLVPAVGLVAAMLVFAPAAAQATITEGHPEAFESGIKVGGKEKSAIQVGWGQIHLESAQLGSEGIECVNLGFGSGYNEGSPLRAYGQILSWTASGHVPEGTHTELSSSCRPHGEAAKPGSFATDELNTKAEEPIEPKNRKLTVPWNVELTCGVREEEFQGIVKTGIPNSAFPGANTKCPAEASETTETEEIESYKAERTGKKGCYATNPAPEGCIRSRSSSPEPAWKSPTAARSTPTGSTACTTVCRRRGGCSPRPPANCSAKRRQDVWPPVRPPERSRRTATTPSL